MSKTCLSICLSFHMASLLGLPFTHSHPPPNAPFIVSSWEIKGKILREASVCRGIRAGLRPSHSWFSSEALGCLQGHAPCSPEPPSLSLLTPSLVEPGMGSPGLQPGPGPSPGAHGPWTLPSPAHSPSPPGPGAQA